MSRDGRILTTKSEVDLNLSRELNLSYCLFLYSLRFYPVLHQQHQRRPSPVPSAAGGTFAEPPIRRFLPRDMADRSARHHANQVIDLVREACAHSPNAHKSLISPLTPLTEPRCLLPYGGGDCGVKCLIRRLG